MERWEPPRTMPADAPRRRKARATPAPRDLPEIWLMVATRVGITLVLTTAVIFEALRNQMHYVALALIAGLIFLIRQSDQVQTRRLRDQSILDLTILLTVIPVAVFAGFVAAETGELLPAERSAYIQTSIATFIAIVVVLVLTRRLFSQSRSLMVAMILPALLVMTSLTFVLHDYRNQTVLAMLALGYFAGAAAIALGMVVEEPFRRYIPAMIYAATLLTGVLVFEPGMANLSEREGLIQIVTWGMALFAFVTLIVLPQQALHLGNLLYGILGPARKRPVQRRRSENDPG